MSIVEAVDPSSAFAPAARIAAMLEHPTLAVAVSEKGRVRQSNAAWTALFALRSDVSIESHLIALFPSGNSADRFERALAAAAKADGRLARVEHMLLRRDGVPFMAEVVVHALDPAQPALSLEDDAVWQVRDITAERQLRRELRELEEYYQALSTYQWDLTFVVDRKDCISFASPSVERALGYRPHAILGEPFASLLAAEGATAGMQWLRGSRQRTEDRPHESYRLRVRHQDGRERVLSCRLRNCLDVPRIAGLVINARDVTEEVGEEVAAEIARARAVRLRERLFELATGAAGRFDERIQTLLEAATDALETAGASYWEVDADGVLTCAYVHLAPYDFLAVDRAEIVDRIGERFDPTSAPRYARGLDAMRPIVVADVDASDAVDAAHRDALVDAGVGALLDFPVAFEGRLHGVVSIAHAGAARAWKVDEIDFAAGISLLVALALESRRREEAASRMAFIAMHDGLTGLANRTHAERELERRIASASVRSTKLAVAMIDLDQFKEVNDGHGHAMGDALLVAVAGVLRDVAGDRALVARMGGDEFLLVCDEASGAQTHAMLERMLKQIGAQPLVEGIEQRVGASVGVARFPIDGADAESLLSAADVAMYEAKKSGRSQVFDFDSRLADRSRLRRELDAEIQGAFERREFCLFYQPQIDLDSGAVVGLEALLRWQHPKHGLLLPDLFIAAALHRGLVETLTKWVLGQVCEQVVAWQRTSLADVPVSVNVTERQFHDRRLPALVAGALMKSALAARCLKLEVDEDVLTGDGATSARVVRELDRLGVAISVCSFGARLRGIAQLDGATVAQVKLDRGLVAGLGRQPISTVLVRALTEVAARLGCQLVAEGVETREQAELLREVGCRVGQGFHLAPPQAAGGLEEFLRSRAVAIADERGEGMR